MNWVARIKIDTVFAYKNNFIDPYSWHQALWQCFPDTPIKKRDFLTRVDETPEGFTAWIVSPKKPNCPPWCPEESWAIKEIAPTFYNHKWYIFDLKANPTRAIIDKTSNGEPFTNERGKMKRGKRVPLVKREDLQAWLEKKAQLGGFKIVENVPLDIGPMVEAYFSKDKHKGYHGSVRFRGVLQVTDRELFKKTYCTGIGSAKAFGYGLLLLAPISLQ